MLRIFSTLGLFSLLTAFAHAQSFPYQFSYVNEPYVTLTNATVVDNITVWDTEESTVPLGFTFMFDNQPQTEMFVLGYSGAILPVGQYENDADTLDAIFGYAVKPGLIPQANTVAQFKTDGAAPNRIFKLEIANAGFDGTQGEVSFQIWLYETSNAIQIRLGSQVTPLPSKIFFNGVSPLIGYMLNYHYTSNGSVATFPQAQFVVGTPAVPQDSVVVNDPFFESLFEGPQYGMSAVPLDNSVFTYVPGTVSAWQPELALMQVLPNPALDHVTLSGMDRSKPARVQLLDVQGKLVQQQELPAGVQTLLLPADLAPGTYFLQYAGEQQMAVSKFIKG